MKRPFSILTLLTLLLTPMSAQAAPTQACGRLETLSTRQALDWLRKNMTQIDERMGQGGLAPWKGRSRKRFLKRLKRPQLPIKCASKPLCEGNAQGQILLGDWEIPLRHTHPIELCTHQLEGLGQYVVVLAHEIGHLVWGNADRRGCEDRCTHPRLSDSLALAAYHAWHGTGHDPTQCPVLCGVAPAPASDGGIPVGPIDSGLQDGKKNVNSQTDTGLEAVNSP